MLEARAFEPDFLRRLDRLVLGVRRARTVRSGQRTIGRVQGLGIEPENFREYAEGDDLRFLDWNAFARLDDLLLRTYRAERQVEITVLLDASASMAIPQRDDKFGLARVLAATFAYIGMAENDAVRIASFGARREGVKLQTTPFYRRREQYQAFKPYLTELQCSGETRLSSAVGELLLQRRPAGVVVVISDFLVNQGDFEEAMLHLLGTRQEIKLVHVMGEMESEGSYPPGLYRVRDCESGELREVAFGPELAESCRGRVAAICERIHEFCVGHAIVYAQAFGARHLDAILERELPVMGVIRQVGLLSPNHLLWAISIAILLAIYLRSRSRPTLEVSSLLLFDEAAAPTTRVRHLRIDPLFWIEMAALAAITLALAGLYIRTSRASARGQNRVLVFDLAAGMGAQEGSGTRLDVAKKQARALVNAAPERDRFSIIGYALEADLIHPETANREAIRHAIDGLRAMAVPGRRAAQSAALMRARAAGEVEFFADRKPPASMVEDSGLGASFHFHQSGAPADNFALVALDPGIVGSARGRATIKNFALHPQTCELAIESDGKPFFHQALVLPPHEQIVVSFGPLIAGGLVHAKLLGPDSLEADNDRYAWAAVDQPAHVLVLSPDAAARDDLARVLLAVNSNFVIAAADPAKFSSTEKYALAVMHDCYVPGVKAPSVLLVFPPLSSSGKIPSLRIDGTAPASILTSQGGDASAAPTALAATRTLIAPDWMSVRAWGNAAGAHEMLPLTAIGALPSGQFGVVAFDVRDHLLLDPDRLDALVAMVDVIRELTAPSQVHIVSTGAFLAVPAPADAKVTAPDGSALAASRDQWGRLRLRPLQPGHYSVESDIEAIDVYANYYDASESDLTALATPSAPEPKKGVGAEESVSLPKQVQPLSALMLTLALIALLVESALLLRTARRWGMRHV